MVPALAMVERISRPNADHSRCRSDRQTPAMQVTARRAALCRPNVSHRDKCMKTKAFLSIPMYAMALNAVVYYVRRRTFHNYKASRPLSIAASAGWLENASYQGF